MNEQDRLQERRDALEYVIFRAVWYHSVGRLEHRIASDVLSYYGAHEPGVAEAIRYGLEEIDKSEHPVTLAQSLVNLRGKEIDIALYQSVKSKTFWKGNKR